MNFMVILGKLHVHQPRPQQPGEVSILQAHRSLGQLPGSWDDRSATVSVTSNISQPQPFSHWMVLGVSRDPVSHSVGEVTSGITLGVRC